MGFMGGQGSWWIKSESDPRWNREGRGFISGILGPTEFSIEEMIKEMKKEYGEAPEDLEAGWMKD